MRKTLAILVGVLIIPVSSEAKLKKSMEKDCLVCHQNWLMESKVNDPNKLTDRALRAGDTIMCLSCHDGSMADDRRLFLNLDKFSHPVDVKVPADFKIPKEYPLENGKLFCGTCHTPHTNDGSKVDYAFMRKPNVNSAMCMDCHKGNVGHGNHPILEATAGKLSPSEIPQIEKLGAKLGNNSEIICESCHSAHFGKSKYALVASNAGAQLCGICHKQELNTPTHKNLNSHPVMVSVSQLGVKPSALNLTLDNGKVDCYTCHKVHHSSYSNLLAEPSGKLCSSCHIKESSILHSKHAFKNGKQCLECHTAHGAYAQYLWGRKIPQKAKLYAKLINAGSSDILCLSCHYPGGKAPDVGSLTHPVNVSFSSSSLPTPAGKVACVTCHDPHKWAAVANAKSPADTSFLRLPEKTLCLKCHKSESGVLANAHKNIKDVNVLGRTPQEAGACAACHVPHRAVGKYLRGIYGKSGTSGFCLKCHSASGIAKDKVMVGKFADHPIGVKNPSKKLPGKLLTCATCHEPHTLAASLLREPASGNSTLCLECHRQKDLRGTAHYLVKKTGKGQCLVCHTPHNPKAQVLWALEPGEGNATVQKLCLSCHAKGKMAQNLTVGNYTHPIDVSFTSPAPKLVPAINEQTGLPAPKSGKVDCSSCHEAHSKVANFLRLDNKGSALCLKCHTKEASVVGTAHDIGKKACAECHVVHNAKGQFLWALNVGKFYANGEPMDKVSDYCLSCHNSKGLASKAVVKYYFHPKKDFTIVSQQRPGRTGNWPIFSEDGKEVKRGGGIGCATCHDPHRFGANKGYFLRNSDRDIKGSLCADCHGDEALIRYMWYHKPMVRSAHPSYR